MECFLWFILIILPTYFFQVLINVCDQVVERSSKFLTQRSRPNSAKLITTSELCSMANLVELLNKESVRMTERVMPGLILSLQGRVCERISCKQSAIFFPNFAYIPHLTGSTIRNRDKVKILLDQIFWQIYQSLMLSGFLSRGNLCLNSPQQKRC